MICGYSLIFILLWVKCLESVRFHTHSKCVNLFHKFEFIERKQKCYHILKRVQLHNFSSPLTCLLAIFSVDAKKMIVNRKFSQLKTNDWNGMRMHLNWNAYKDAFWCETLNCIPIESNVSMVISEQRCASSMHSQFFLPNDLQETAWNELAACTNTS